jgi:hypothetical protein
MQHKNGHNQGKLMIFSGNILFLGYWVMGLWCLLPLLLVEETGVAGENLASKA